MKTVLISLHDGSIDLPIVKCPVCGSMNIDLVEIRETGEIGLKATLRGVRQTGRKEVRHTAFYTYGECNTTFHLPLRGAA